MSKNDSGVKKPVAVGGREIFIPKGISENELLNLLEIDLGRGKEVKGEKDQVNEFGISVRLDDASIGEDPVEYTGRGRSGENIFEE